jgi:hypothetical protein
VYIGKAASIRDALQRHFGILQNTPGRIQPGRFDKIGRRYADVAQENARKIARAHIGASGKQIY